MARDRQRAKQRKARRAGQNPGPESTEPRRANVPGELDHASGEADEFDAALVAGAGGRTADDPDPDAADADADDRDLRDGDEDAGEPVAEEPLDEEDAALEREAVAAGGGRRERAVERDRPGAPTRSGPARFLAFLRASWAELQRVQWPDRRQVAQATAVVIGFVIIAGVYLGIADRVAQEVVDLII